MEELRAAVSDGFLSESHRSRRFRMELDAMEEALRALLAIPDSHRVLVVASATEAMERLVQGVVRERSGHLINGAFAGRFRDIARRLGRSVEEHTVPDGSGFSAGGAASRLAASGVEMLAMTQNETSTGVRILPEQVHGLAESARAGGALAAVDLVTGWPTEAVDPARIDAGFFSVQKGFGLPAGLGIIVASPGLVERSMRLEADGHAVGGYLGLPGLAAAADRSETRVTPNMLAIRLLRRVATEYAEEGRDRLDAAVRRKARGFWSAIEGLEGMRPSVADPEIRSRTVLVVEVDAPGSAPVLEWLQQKGIAVSDGYGRWKGRHLRIANFPVQTSEMMEELLEALAEFSSDRLPPAG